MNNKYFFAQLKRLVFLSKAMIFNLILSLIAIVLILTLINKKNPEELKLKLGIVSDDKTTYLGMGVDIINTMDAAADRISFINMAERDAKNALNAGKIIGYLYIPDGFINALQNGENKEISYVTSKMNSNLINEIVCEISDIVSVLIVSSEKSIYAMESYMYDVNTDAKSYNQALDDINMMLIKKVFGRDVSLNIKILDESASLSPEKYYLASFLIIYLYLIGVSVSSFANKHNQTLHKALASKGLSAFHQIFSEYLAYSIFLIISIMLLIISAFMISIFFRNNLFDILGIGFMQLLLIIFTISLLLAAIISLIFEISADRISGILILCLSCIILGFCGGCFYPLRLFPKALKYFGRLSPLYPAVKYTHSIILNEANVFYLGFMLLYTIALFLLTVFIRRSRINHV